MYLKPKNLNEGYAEETWLVFPLKNGLISKSKQSEDIQTLLDHGIDNLIGLNLFLDGMPADSKNQRFKAILEPCDDLGLEKIDTIFVASLIMYVFYRRLVFLLMSLFTVLQSS